MDKGEVDRYLSESILSFKHAESKNSARRGSLVKKTKGLELQQKMATAKMTKEERQLRESLRQMKIEQRRNTTVREEVIKIGEAVSKSKEVQKKPKTVEKKRPSADVDPYPVTFPALGTPSPSRSPHPGNRGSPGLVRKRPGTGSSWKRQDSSLVQSCNVSPRANDRREEKVRLLAARARGRRVSHEFEDLNVDTQTGSLNAFKSGPTHAVAARFLSRELSSNDFGGSVSSLSSVEDLYWAGEPEAITSVRRPRKTSEQQSRDALMKKSLSDVHKK